MSMKTQDYRLLCSNASKSVCLSIEGMTVPIALTGTYQLLNGVVSSRALQQLAGTNELCLPLDNPCWVAESNVYQAHVYQQQARTSLVCVDEHSMLTV